MPFTQIQDFYVRYSGHEMGSEYQTKHLCVQMSSELCIRLNSRLVHYLDAYFFVIQAVKYYNSIDNRRQNHRVIRCHLYQDLNTKCFAILQSGQ